MQGIEPNSKVEDEDGDSCDAGTGSKDWDQGSYMSNEQPWH